MPERPALDALLEAAGLKLEWDEPNRAYHSPVMRPSYLGSTTTDRTTAAVDDEADDAHALDERLKRVVETRGFLALSVSPQHLSNVERHLATALALPITELPAHWPPRYRILVERRIDLIRSDRFIGLNERPEYKRRWNVESWREQEQRALRNCLLGRLESPAYWPEPRLATVRTLAERAATDADFRQVAARYAGHQGFDIEPLVAALVEAESVPALPAQRYKPSGLAKRADWERAWRYSGRRTPSTPRWRRPPEGKKKPKKSTQPDSRPSSVAANRKRSAISRPRPSTALRTF